MQSCTSSWSRQAKCGICRLIIAAVAFFSFVATCFATEPSLKPLSSQPLRIAVADNYSPFTVLGPKQKPSGLIVEIWELWSRYSGYPIEFTALEWPETLDALQQGRVDVHSGMFENAERAKHFLFTQPIAEIPTGVFYLPGHQPKSKWVDDLKGKRVAAVTGSYQQLWLEEKHTNINVRGALTNDDLVQGLLSGKYDAVVSEIPAMHASLAKIGLQGAVERLERPLFTNHVLGAVSRSNPQLLDIINQGLEKIPVEELIAVERRWLNDPATRYFERQNQITPLTDEEKQWLREHPTVNVGVTTFITPVDIMRKDGGYSGFNAELMRMLSEQLGVHFIPVFHDTWSSVVDDAVSGKVDATMSLSRTPERERYLIFTRPYAYDPVVILSRSQDRSIKSWADIEGKKVSVVKGFAVLSDVQGAVSNGELVIVKDEREGLRLLALGQVDAHVSNLIPYGNVQKADFVPGLRVAVSRNSESSTLRIGVHNTNPTLASILDKALTMIPPTQLLEVWNKWTLPQQDKMKGLNLTGEEKAWLAKQTSLTFGTMTAWPPLTYMDASGRLEGINSRLSRALNKRLDGKIHLKPAPFKQSYQAVLQGELDGLFDITPRPERRELFNFTEPYLKIPHVVVAHKDAPFIQDEAALTGKVVALEQGFFNVKRMRESHPDVTVREYADTAKALDAVARGEADAYVGNRAVATHIIRHELLHNLKIHGRASFDPVVLALGVRKDNIILRNIMNKALADITLVEKQDILENGNDNKRQGDRPLALSPEEKAWIADNPTVEVGVDGNWAPIDFYDENGHHAGILNDYLMLLEQKTGIKFKRIQGANFADMLGRVRSGQLPMAGSVAFAKDRAKDLHYIAPFVAGASSIFVKKGATIKSIADLKGRSVAMPKGFITGEILSKEYPEIRQLEVSSTLEALRAVSYGKADAYVGSHAVGVWLARKNQLVDIVPVAADTMESKPNFIVVHKHDPSLAPLKSILEKAMGSIDERQKAYIEGRWFGAGVQSSENKRISLTADERKWIAENPVIRVHNEKTWAPFSFFEAGKAKGFSVDYMNLLAEKLGLQVEYVTGPTWNEFLTMLREHRLDVMLNIVKTPEREKYILFTEPYVENPPVVIARQGSGIEYFDDLKVGKSICIPAGYFYEELLKAKYPAIHILNADDQTGCLNMVSSGDADATIGGLAVQTYLISKHLLTNLAVSASINDPILNNRLRFGVRDDWPQLQALMDKAIATVTEEERAALSQRWITATINQQDLTDATSDQALTLEEILTRLGGIVGAFLLLLLAMIAIYRLIIKKTGARFQDSNVVVWSGVLLVTLFLGGVVIATWMVLDSFEKSTRQRIASSLTTILHGTHQSFQVWVDAEKKFVQTLVADCEASHVVERLVDAADNGDDLNQSPHQQSLRDLLAQKFTHDGALSYGLLSASGRVLASSYSKDIGQQSDMLAQSAGRFVKAVVGGTAFIPPLEGNGLTNNGGVPEVFFASAVKDMTGRVIAVLVIGYPMSEAYSKIVSSGRLLETGETYVLDNKGRMLSKSRFSDDLLSLGLIDDDVDGFTRLHVLDPGVDLHVHPELATPLDQRPLTRMAKDVTSGRFGVDVSENGYRDYRGVPVFGAWVWDDVNNLGIAMEVDVDEALGSFYRIQTILLSLVGSAVFIGLSLTAVSIMLGRRATQELEAQVEERTRELKTSKEQSSLILTSIGEGLFGTDAEGRIIFINPAACALLGYEADELLGQRAHATFHYCHSDGSHYPVENCPMFHAFTDGTVSRIDDEVLWRKDGTSFPVEYNATPMRVNGELVGSVISFLDISRRLESQRQLEDREARIAAIMENVADAIITIDPRGIVESCNKAVETIFGYTSQELVGQNVTQLMPPEYKHHHDGYLARYVETGKGQIIGKGTREVLAVRKSGEMFPSELSVGEAFVGGQRLFVGGMRDISERKQAQEKLAQAFAVISDSISYASRIQKSVLPPDQVLNTTLAEHFVIWQPRDVVGGDIYWGGLWGDGVLVALADCTGHGVPGAFMTLITAGALDRAMSEVQKGDVAALMTRVHQIVQFMLSQHTGKGESDDGLEMGLCYITPKMDRLQFAGARFSVFEVKPDGVNEIKGTKKGLGYRGIPINQAYDVCDIQLTGDQTFVMTTDGMIDQIGGEKHRAYGKRRFVNVLEQAEGQPLDQIKARLLESFEAYQGGEQRRDDVAVIGFRVTDV